jgi:hypothetical protein
VPDVHEGDDGLPGVELTLAPMDGTLAKEDHTRLLAGNEHVQTWHVDPLDQGPKATIECIDVGALIVHPPQLQLRAVRGERGLCLLQPLLVGLKGEGE